MRSTGSTAASPGISRELPPPEVPALPNTAQWTLGGRESSLLPHDVPTTGTVSAPEDRPRLAGTEAETGSGVDGEGTQTGALSPAVRGHRVDLKEQ
jgi:hypothetical protein